MKNQSQPLQFVVILGTNRDGRESEKAATFVMEAITAHDDMEATLFDVRQFPIPADDYGQALKKTEPFAAYRQAIIAADGIIIVTPEYNHGYPGTLKSLLDTVLKEYIHKPVGFVGVSSGQLGGARVIENLLPVVREMGMIASFTDLRFPNIAEQFDDDNRIVDEQYHERAAAFVSELAWLARTLRWGRNNVPSEHSSS